MLGAIPNSVQAGGRGTARLEGLGRPHPGDTHGRPAKLRAGRGGGCLRTERRSRVRLDHGVCEGCAVLSGLRAGDGWADGPGSPADTQLHGTARVGRIYSGHAACTDTYGVQSNCLFSLMERLTCTPPGPRTSRGPCLGMAPPPRCATHLPSSPGPGPHVTAPWHPRLAIDRDITGVKTKCRVFLTPFRREWRDHRMTSSDSIVSRLERLSEF